MADTQQVIDRGMLTRGIDAVKKGLEIGADADRQASQRKGTKLGNLRYPVSVGSKDSPYVLFTTHRAQYNDRGASFNTTPTGNSVALYVPTNISVSDSLRYESVSTGLIGSVMEKGVENITGDDLTSIAFNNAEVIAGVVGGAAGSAAGTLGTLIGVGGAASVVGNVKAEISKTRQRVMNPREFMLFRSPTIRQFGYNFTFIPQSEEEAKSIPRIIQFFRQAAYPTLHTGGIDYVFPDAFNIRYGNTNSMIRMPETVCISVNVTYNPNSISFFRYDNMPVEISLQLQFQELKPIDQSLVVEGY